MRVCCREAWCEKWASIAALLLLPLLLQAFGTHWAWLCSSLFHNVMRAA